MKHSTALACLMLVSLAAVDAGAYEQVYYAGTACTPAGRASTYSTSGFISAANSVQNESTINLLYTNCPALNHRNTYTTIPDWRAWVVDNSTTGGVQAYVCVSDVFGSVTCDSMGTPSADTGYYALTSYDTMAHAADGNFSVRFILPERDGVSMSKVIGYEIGEN